MSAVLSCCFTSFYFFVIPLSLLPVSRPGSHRAKHSFLRFRIKDHDERSLLPGVPDDEKPIVVTFPHDMLASTYRLNLRRRDVVPGNMCRIPIVPYQGWLPLRKAYNVCSIMAPCATRSQELKRCTYTATETVSKAVTPGDFWDTLLRRLLRHWLVPSPMWITGSLQVSQKGRLRHFV